MAIPILSEIERLINERGSAAILQKHVSLLKEELALIDKKIKDLESTNSNLVSENKQLNHQVQIIHGISLNEKHTLTLLAVASKSGSELSLIASYSGLSNEETLDKLNYLESLGIIKINYITRTWNEPDKPFPISKNLNTWTVTPKGHGYINYKGLADKVT